MYHPAKLYAILVETEDRPRNGRNRTQIVRTPMVAKTVEFGEMR